MSHAQSQLSRCLDGSPVPNPSVGENKRDIRGSLGGFKLSNLHECVAQRRRLRRRAAAYRSAGLSSSLVSAPVEAEVCVTSETFGKHHPARQPQRLVTSGFSARMEKYKLPVSPKPPAGGLKQAFIFLLLPPDSTTALWHVVIYQVIPHTHC